MTVQILIGDARERLRDLPDASVHCCITSPPYFGLRDYGVEGQIGREETPDAFVAGLVELFREVRRVLRPDGTLWLNLGDSYARTGGTDRQVSETASVGNTKRSAEMISDRTQKGVRGLADKQLIGIPWRVAFALQADGWWLRQDIIWAKPNPMPESVTDRCTKAHEYLFLLSPSATYYFDAEAIKETATCDRQRGSGPMVAKGTGRADADTGTSGDYRARNGDDQRRNKRGVWEVATRSFGLEMCTACGTVYDVKAYRVLSREEVWDGDVRRADRVHCTCGRADAWLSHFATFPPDLIRDCVRAGTPPDGTVLDPFGGAGTTGLVADQESRDAILIELNPDYAELARTRLRASKAQVRSDAPEVIPHIGGLFDHG